MSGLRKERPNGNNTFNNRNLTVDLMRIQVNSNFKTFYSSQREIDIFIKNK